MHLPDFRIARGQWLYHIGVGISRVALIGQFHPSMGDINVEAVDGYSWEAFVAPQSDSGDDILQILSLKLTGWNLRFWWRRWIYFAFVRSRTYDWIHVPKMILKSVSSWAVLFFFRALPSLHQGSSLPSFFNSMFGIFLTEGAGWRWCTITSCASALLFCGACC